MKLALTAALLGTTATQLSAQSLASYGGDYVTANQLLNITDLANDQFSPTTQRQPAAGYTGPVFYAGYGISGSPGLSSSNNNVLNSGTLDPIQFGLSGGTTARTMAGVIMFNVSGWQSTNQALEFSARGDISVAGGGLNFDEVRLVVRSGTDYFASTDSGSFGISPGSTVSFTASSWLEYDPETSLLGALGSTQVNSLSSVDAVGVYLRAAQNDTAASTSFRPRLYELDVTAVVVPEPAALSALLVGGLLLGRRRRD